MLPIITIGLTPAARAVMERIPGNRGQAHYPTAEAALWDFGSVSNPTVAQISLDAKGQRWSCHVFYGEDSFGALLTGTKLDPKATRVPAQGLVAVITDSVGEHPTTPYRVVDGQPEQRPGPKLSGMEALAVLQASMLLIVDELGTNPQWQDSVAKMLDNAEPDPNGEQLGFVPGEEARVELARLEALRAKGRTRPGHFETQGRTGGLLP